MFHDSIAKISENLKKWNLLETYLQFTRPTDFCLLCSLWEKVKPNE